ncbi:hypothetical protein [Natronobacterium gregoryi]|uniref:Uncharacterized protein n=2 Tax=Natronobacterium gregoryi TaxID=44930 RepID=L0AG08_NATGS|nr:hypothetical protein [Natronobacterium gregoryi]AFZ72000.1 hypothetical protein Natgr_0758 [Natronobacterium gregoryi SP2]SFJ19758.1 hypothetical protein SAMN05443661_11738 [Natronobacterium gregoryi]
MATERLRAGVATLYSRWQALERDWQSVAVAVIVVGTTVALEIQIPW